MKTCSKCKKTKSRDQFHIQSGKKDGLRSHCKKCRASHHKNIYPLRDPEYGVWVSMNGRCLSEGNHAYPLYGGRGISVCERWRKSYQNFIADMGYRPEKGYDIDRIDNDGDYTPENCRWVTHKENTRNRSTSKLDQGKVLKMKTLRQVGLSYGKIAKSFNISRSYARQVCIGNYWD